MRSTHARKTIKSRHPVKKSAAVKPFDEEEVRLATQYLSSSQVIAYLDENRDRIPRAIYESLYLRAIKIDITKSLSLFPVYNAEDILKIVFGDLYIPGANTREFCRKFIAPILTENKLCPTRIADAIRNRGYKTSHGVVIGIMQEYTRALDRDNVWSESGKVVPMMNRMPVSIQAKSEGYLERQRNQLQVTRNDNLNLVSSFLNGDAGEMASFMNFEAIQDLVARLSDDDKRYHDACQDWGLIPDDSQSLSFRAASYFHHAIDNGVKLAAITNLLPESVRAQFLREHGTCKSNVANSGFFANSCAASDGASASHNNKPQPR